ncbi:hypothetical protein [Grimontia sp. NTOU-MAR1]|uniref:hypothetical protein n=1 Tax=Grimontia sp. NTOU-MAR1 TaxID=3111011 RepID=UPI002DB8B517|nr:hypothetical protein [Grimontia sp. NTOU-MAR1]WRV96264.1 hypothetical protein VP504_08945 [Grimontia sp. NTOU-MAR1]
MDKSKPRTEILSMRRSSLIRKSSPEEYFDSAVDTNDIARENLIKARLKSMKAEDRESLSSDLDSAFNLSN